MPRARRGAARARRASAKARNGLGRRRRRSTRPPRILYRSWPASSTCRHVACRHVAWRRGAPACSALARPAAAVTYRHPARPARPAHLYRPPLPCPRPAPCLAATLEHAPRARRHLRAPCAPCRQAAADCTPCATAWCCCERGGWRRGGGGRGGTTLLWRLLRRRWCLASPPCLAPLPPCLAVVFTRHLLLSWRCLAAPRDSTLPVACLLLPLLRPQMRLGEWQHIIALPGGVWPSRCASLLRGTGAAAGGHARGCRD